MLEGLFLELANVKTVEYADSPTEISPKIAEKGSLVSENDLHVLVDAHRDKSLQGEGVMRDLARRVQALRKELGFTPTEILEAVDLAELDDENTKLLKPHLKAMAELVRTRDVHVHESRSEAGKKWYEVNLDSKRVYIAIH
jgi:isoleucyl-tRNA synthetase